MYADHTILNDGVRLARFREALRARVRPGDVVLDAGTGTGILAVMAAQAGAGHVYAVESRGIIELARDVVQANGCADRITLIRGDVQTVSLPEKADGVVCELLGYAGLAEGIARLLPRVIESHLKPGAWRIPGDLRVYAAPVQHAALHEYIMLAHADAGVDLGPVLREIVQNYWVENLAGADLLAPPCVVFAADWSGEPGRSSLRQDAPMTARRHGVVHGFGAWFTAELAPGVTLDTGPHAPLTSWRQVFFPLPQPVPVREGDTLGFDLTSMPMTHGEMFHWKCAVARGRQTLFEAAYSNALSCHSMKAFEQGADGNS
jgi:protein arginine N-methyltransferase 1